MRIPLRVAVIDPSPDSREALIGLIDRTEGIWLAEACASYAVAADRMAEILPDITLVVVDDDFDRGVALIEAIVQGNPDGSVLAAGAGLDSPRIFRLIRAGAKEFLPLPAGEAEFRGTIGQFFPRSEEPFSLAAARGEAPAAPASRSKMIAVTGAVGEVGCTTLAVNLATTLAKLSGLEVALADFDLLFGSIDAQLDLVPENTLLEIVASIDRLDAMLLKRMLTPHNSGVSLLSHPFALEDAARLEHEGLHRTLELLKSAFPIGVIDTSKSLQASDFLAFEVADIILITLFLDPICLRNTARLVQCLRSLGGLDEKVRLVANRVGSQFTQITLSTAEEMLQRPVDFQIPNATKVFHPARDRGVPIDVVSPRSDAQRAFVTIARSLGVLQEEAEKTPPKKTLRNRFRSK